MYLNKLTALIALALSTSATAQVYELNFTDTNAKSVVKAPTATWFNPTDSVIVTAISGLDRKIKLELIKGTTVEQSQTSSLITLANRIVASDGSEFYGTKFTLTRPADGNYTLRSTVLDIKGWSSPPTATRSTSIPWAVHAQCVQVHHGGGNRRLD